MNSSNPDRQSTPLTTPHRKIDIILLTDNRDGNSQERPFSEFRCSAFKETEVDPLEERGRDGQWGDLIDDLNKRVGRLEDKVQELIHMEEGEPDQPRTKSKKRRRRFDEMQREYRCLQCPRVYGSETALKNHVKLKHAEERSIQ